MASCSIPAGRPAVCLGSGRSRSEPMQSEDCIVRFPAFRGASGLAINPRAHSFRRSVTRVAELDLSRAFARTRFIQTVPSRVLSRSGSSRARLREFGERPSQRYGDDSRRDFFLQLLRRSSFEARGSERGRLELRQTRNFRSRGRRGGRETGRRRPLRTLRMCT